MISVLAEQGLIISGIIAAIACLTPIIVLIATIGMVENAMRRLDVPGLLAPVMASCALFVAL